MTETVSAKPPKAKNNSEKLRIAFFLNLRRYPQLAYLKDIKGHGAHPEELVRLALLGLKAQAEAEDLLRATRQASLAAVMRSVQTGVGRLPQSVEGDEKNEQVSFPEKGTPKVSDASSKDAPVKKQRESASDIPSTPPAVAKNLRSMLA